MKLEFVSGRGSRGELAPEVVSIVTVPVLRKIGGKLESCEWRAWARSRSRASLRCNL